MSTISVNDVLIGDSHPPIIVAELGINHGGDLDTAIKMADAALTAGVKFIKNQTHNLVDEMSEEAKFTIPGNTAQSIYQVIARNLMSEADEFELKKFIEDKGGVYFTTPFSLNSLERVKKLDVPLIKIGSGEANNYPFVKKVSSLGRPVILSTGMNTIKSIAPSVAIFEQARIPYALLHCTNLYPTPEKLVRLDAIKELKESFPNAVVGLSDHSTSIYPCLGAVALGASILERHFTDDPNREGPDIPCSSTPQQLKQLIEGSHAIFLARGGEKSLLQEEDVTRNFAFSSIAAIDDISEGDILTEENIRLMRPSGGFYGPRDFERLLGERAKINAKKGFQLPKGIT